jgi:hypothetical protein
MKGCASFQPESPSKTAAKTSQATPVSERGRLVYSSQFTTNYATQDIARIVLASLRLKGYAIDVPADWKWDIGHGLDGVKADEGMGRDDSSLASGATRELTVTPIQLDSHIEGVQFVVKGWYKPPVAKNPWAGAAQLSRELTREQDWLIAVLAGERGGP